MDVHEKLQYLLDERGWTKYQLARKCGLSDATIANIFRRNTMPSIPTLEAICQGFGITLAQFFSQGQMVELSDEQKEMFDTWSTLTKEQKDALYQLIMVMKAR